MGARADDVDDVARLRAELTAAKRQISALRVENSRLRAAATGQLTLDIDLPVRSTVPPSDKPPSVDKNSALSEKLSLFRVLFAGRTDVYAARWVNTRSGKKGWSPVEVDRWARRDDADRQFVPSPTRSSNGTCLEDSGVGRLAPNRTGTACRDSRRGDRHG
jgi:hypothetical protein